MAEPSWLLRATRLNAAQGRWRTAAVFAQGNGEVPAVNRSQVTRWERGEIAPTYAVVRRYEVLCELPEGHLACAFDLVHRHARPIAATPVLRRPPGEDAAAETDALVSRALEDEPLTGLEWDRLSALLGETPASFMLGRDWQRLVRRGLREMEVSVRLGYCQRSEAMSRIAGHPRAAHHTAELVRDILSDPHAQVYSEAAALLRYVDHPDAHRTLQEVIADPVSPHARRAALYAAAPLVRDRRTPHETAAALVRTALEIARDPQQPYRVRRSAADVLLALRPATRASIADEFRRRPEDLALASIVTGDGPRSRAQSRALRTRIVDRVQGLATSSLHDQPELLKLLNYITVESNDELRSFALYLLMLLPFGPAVGHAYLAELAACVEDGDEFAMHEVLGVLIALTPGENLTLLTDLAVRSVPLPEDGDQIAMEAAWGLGNAPVVPGADPTNGEPSVAFPTGGDPTGGDPTGGDPTGGDPTGGGPTVADRIAAAVRESWSGLRPTPPELVEAWAYALGMRGRVDLLTGLVAPPGALNGPTWERSRQWWLDVPRHLLAGPGR